jgi:hypothetical protein
MSVRNLYFVTVSRWSAGTPNSSSFPRFTVRRSEAGFPLARGRDRRAVHRRLTENVPETWDGLSMSVVLRDQVCPCNWAAGASHFFARYYAGNLATAGLGHRTSPRSSRECSVRFAFASRRTDLSLPSRSLKAVLQREGWTLTITFNLDRSPAPLRTANVGASRDS